MIERDRKLRPPEENEVEVSLFGPGYGECVVVHLGFKDWIIVDSCIDKKSNTPASLNYLHSIGVDPASDVNQIIATHWHDDHIRGLSTVLSSCEQSEFVCSDALMEKEFLTLIESIGDDSSMASSGVDEFKNILEILDERDSSYENLVFGSKERVLWQRNDDHSEFECSIQSLSPSDAQKLIARKRLSKLIPESGERKKRLPGMEPNDASVVVWIQVGKSNLLLGADLECTGDENTGWTSVVESHRTSSDRASLFKIPHHGSGDAHCRKVWTDLLVDQSYSGVTPWRKGGNDLPTKNDMKRIKSNTNNSFISTYHTKKRKNRDRTVQKLIDTTVNEIHRIDPITGHVRFRSLITDNSPKWSVECFNGATPLREINLNK